MMMVPLQAAARERATKAKALRHTGNVPCILYGFDTENILLQCEEHPLKKAYLQAGESTLVELDTGAKKVPVLFQHVQFDPLSQRFAHVDFYAVNMKEEIETKVPIRFEGVAPALQELEAVLVTTKDHVTVRCLPGDLPHNLSVSLESLKEIGDSITIATLSLPKGVVLIEKPDSVLALIQEKQKEEVIAPPVAAEGTVPAEGAVTTEGGEEKTEGEAPEKAEKKSEKPEKKNT